MTDDCKSGLALIAGSVASIITMSLHPTGHDIFVPGRFHAVAQMAVAVHALALLSLPVMFLGACGLSLRLAAPNRLAWAGLVIYAFALLAVMNAAVASGLIAPGLARRILDAAPAGSEGWDIVFHYNFELNQAFALVFVVASSAAILLWSSAILRDGQLARGVGTYGCILGPISLLAVLSGHLQLGVHGFGLVVVGQALWFIPAGVSLCRSKISVRT